jgi:hypothetical protein
VRRMDRRVACLDGDGKMAWRRCMAISHAVSNRMQSARMRCHAHVGSHRSLPILIQLPCIISPNDRLAPFTRNRSHSGVRTLPPRCTTRLHTNRQCYSVTCTYFAFNSPGWSTDCRITLNQSEQTFALRVSINYQSDKQVIRC